MSAKPNKITRLPVDPKERRERQLTALWAKADELEKQLAEVRHKARPLQRDVSLGRGYLFTVSREVLQREMGR